MLDTQDCVMLILVLAVYVQTYNALTYICVFILDK